MAHLQLKFKTVELQQDEALSDLPKAIRSSIAQHLFQRTVENAYLFKGVSQDMIIQMVIYLPFRVQCLDCKVCGDRRYTIKRSNLGGKFTYHLCRETLYL